MHVVIHSVPRLSGSFGGLSTRKKELIIISQPLSIKNYLTMRPPSRSGRRGGMAQKKKVVVVVAVIVVVSSSSGSSSSGSS